MSPCPTGKRRFRTELDAKIELAGIDRKRPTEKDEVRAYRCPQCKGFPSDEFGGVGMNADEATDFTVPLDEASAIAVRMMLEKADLNELGVIFTISGDNSPIFEVTATSEVSPGRAIIRREEKFYRSVGSQ